MFLDRLKSEEKKAFMVIANHAAEINGVVEEQEKQLLSEYCLELQISGNEAEGMKYEEAVPLFALAERSKKRILIFEILGLLYADGVFDDEEKQFIVELTQSIGLNKNEFDRILASLDRYIESVTEITEVILSEK